MCTPMTSSYINYMTIVMILFVVYNGTITSGKYWFLQISDSIPKK
jgi:hypothetical protein